MMKNLIKYFLQGLFYTVPAAITIYLAIRAITFIDHILPVSIPGLGTVLIITIVTLAGYFGSMVLSSSIGIIVKRAEKVMLKIPVIKLLYTAIKDLFSALIGSKKTFDQAVLVKINKSEDIEKIGFVTKSDLSDIGVGKDKVAVYFPFSYAITGDLVVVPKANVRPIDANPADVMKFVVSGGVAQLNQEDS
jgi:uncharacterized membrane protein